MPSLFEILRASIEVFGTEHFDSARCVDTNGALDRESVTSYRKGIVATRFGERVETPTNILRPDEGCSSIQAAHLIDLISFALQPFDSMANDRDSAGMVVR
ncbi:hypothetical protein D3C87_1443910 [compost metagenome]